MYQDKGFTLIELLVVVLIIGILSAVALPQYQYAVKKARFQQAITLVDALAKAQTIYFMTNGEYASDIELLDIALPADFTVRGTSANNRNLTCDVFNGRIYCVFRGQGLSNVAYMYSLSDGMRACVSFARSDEQTHKFCKRLTGKENFETYGAWSIYNIDA